MAFDLMLGETAADWSRGELDELELAGDWLAEAARAKATREARKVPWAKVLLGVGIAAGVMAVVPSTVRKTDAARTRREHRSHGDRTIKIPRLSMRETVYGK